LGPGDAVIATPLGVVKNVTAESMKLFLHLSTSACSWSAGWKGLFAGCLPVTERHDFGTRTERSGTWGGMAGLATALPDLVFSARTRRGAPVVPTVSAKSGQDLSRALRTLRPMPPRLDKPIRAIRLTSRFSGGRFHSIAALLQQELPDLLEAPGMNVEGMETVGAATRILLVGTDWAGVTMPVEIRFGAPARVTIISLEGHPFRASATITVDRLGSACYLRQENVYQPASFTAALIPHVGLEERISDFWRSFHARIRARVAGSSRGGVL
jgi:hypothetical protein